MGKVRRAGSKYWWGLMAGEKKETIKNASMFLFILGIRGTSEKRKR